ncbi:MAG: helix-turn-helix domain-containing protein [Baekduia sp.]
MEFDSRPFWKPRDLATLLDVSSSQIYRLIEAGTLEHVKVGQRTVRVPAASVAQLLGVDAPAIGPQTDAGFDLDARAASFTERTGRTPEEFIVAWRRDEIPDTPEHNHDAMEALALREARVASRAVSTA